MLVKHMTAAQLLVLCPKLHLTNAKVNFKAAASLSCLSPLSMLCLLLQARCL
jgi:hypothetical protein